MKKDSHNELEYVEWGGFLNEFLWMCCGVNRKVVRQCPTDYAKYAGMGGTILFTAIMASLSGSYALFSVFDDEVVAICFGVFWGLLIFNLDRFIVNTMYSDGKVTISWQEIKSGLPRIIMAIFLGIVISTPLELKIFEDAIDIRIEQDKDKLLQDKISGSVQLRDSIAQKRDEIMNGVALFDSQITTSSTETNSLLSGIQALQGKITPVRAKVQELSNEIRMLNSRIAMAKKNNVGYASLLQKRNALRSQRSSLQMQLNNLNSEVRRKSGEAAASDGRLKDLMARKQDETTKESERLQHDVDSINNIINEANVRHKDWDERTIKERGSFRDKLDVEYKGFQAKMSAFSELKEESASTQIASLFIMLLFVIIETAPTFFKMMIASGPYDDMLRAEMYRVRVLADKQISDLNDEVNTEVTISTERNKQKLEAELKANQDLMNKVALAQSEILNVAIDEWRKSELKKVAENPSAYIQSNVPDNNEGVSFKA